MNARRSGRCLDATPFVAEEVVKQQHLAGTNSLYAPNGEARGSVHGRCLVVNSSELTIKGKPGHGVVENRRRVQDSRVKVRGTYTPPLSMTWVSVIGDHDLCQVGARRDKRHAIRQKMGTALSDGPTTQFMIVERLPNPTETGPG